MYQINLYLLKHKCRKTLNSIIIILLTLHELFYFFMLMYKRYPLQKLTYMSLINLEHNEWFIQLPRYVNYNVMLTYIKQYIPITRYILHKVHHLSFSFYLRFYVKKFLPIK